MDDINVKTHQVIKDKLGVDESAIINSASFYDDLDVDSLDFCELIVDIENEFNITIPDELYEKFKTVGSLVDYVSRQANLNALKAPGINPVAEERLSA